MTWTLFKLELSPKLSPKFDVWSVFITKSLPNTCSLFVQGKTNIAHHFFFHVLLNRYSTCKFCLAKKFIEDKHPWSIITCCKKSTNGEVIIFVYRLVAWNKAAINVRDFEVHVLFMIKHPHTLRDWHRFKIWFWVCHLFPVYISYSGED